MSPKRISFVMIWLLAITFGIFLGYLRPIHSLPKASNSSLQARADFESQPAMKSGSFRERDIGERIHEIGRPAHSFRTSVELGATGFEASAGPGRYTDEDNDDWDFYSIKVTKPNADGTVLDVYFSREYEVRAILPTTIGMNVAELARFDEATNSVTFELGGIVECFQVPSP